MHCLNISRRQVLAAALALAVAGPAAAQAQAWPEKPIRLVVGFAPAVLPDNSDGPVLSEAMAGGRFPSFAASGINLTHHVRRPPRRPARSRAHLKIVK